MAIAPNQVHIEWRLKPGPWVESKYGWFPAFGFWQLIAAVTITKRARTRLDKLGPAAFIGHFTVLSKPFAAIDLSAVQAQLEKRVAKLLKSPRNYTPITQVPKTHRL